MSQAGLHGGLWVRGLSFFRDINTPPSSLPGKEQPADRLGYTLDPPYILYPRRRMARTLATQTDTSQYPLSFLTLPFIIKVIQQLL